MVVIAIAIAIVLGAYMYIYNGEEGLGKLDYIYVILCMYIGSSKNNNRISNELSIYGRLYLLYVQYTKRHSFLPVTIYLSSSSSSSTTKTSISSTTAVATITYYYKASSLIYLIQLHGLHKHNIL